MHHQITKQVFDDFPPERKSDFWAGYLYLKYTEHFFNYSLQSIGLEPRKDPPQLDEGIEEMLQASHCRRSRLVSRLYPGNFQRGIGICQHSPGAI